MCYETYKAAVKNAATSLSETRIKDGQPYNTRTIGFHIEVVVNGEEYVQKSRYGATAYKMLCERLGLDVSAQEPKSSGAKSHRLKKLLDTPLET